MQVHIVFFAETVAFEVLTESLLICHLVAHNLYSTSQNSKEKRRDAISPLQPQSQSYCP